MSIDATPVTGILLRLSKTSTYIHQASVSTVCYTVEDLEFYIHLEENKESTDAVLLI